jgi:hypothetical protein
VGLKQKDQLLTLFESSSKQAKSKKKGGRASPGPSAHSLTTASENLDLMNPMLPS